MWEVFDPRYGKALWTVRYSWIARLLCTLCRNFDWARADTGW
jgi:hypothetical protein